MEGLPVSPTAPTASSDSHKVTTTKALKGKGSSSAVPRRARQRRPLTLETCKPPEGQMWQDRGEKGREEGGGEKERREEKGSHKTDLGYNIGAPIRQEGNFIDH